MEQKKRIALTDEEVLQKFKGLKSPYQISLATFIVSIVLTIIRAAVSGLSLSLLYLPLFVAIIAITIRINYKAVKEEMKARNLEHNG